MNFLSDGYSFYKDGRYAKALEMFLSTDVNPAENPELAYYIGLCHARLENFEKAASYLRQSLQNDKHPARIYQARLLLSWLLIQSEEFERAEHNLLRLIDEGYESPQVWSVLGYCHWCLGHQGKAIESYRKAVDVDESNANAINGLGYLLAETGENIQEALHLCRKALEKDPKNVSYQDSLGWALFRDGKIQDSVRFLEKALSGKPDDKLIKDHLKTVKNHA